MTPPIEGSFQVEINDSKKAESIVSSLDKEERKLLLAVLNKGKSKEEKSESKETVTKGLDKPTIEQIKEMTKFYENIDKKLFEIDYTCLPRYDEHHGGNKRQDILQKRMENLIEMFETEGDENFLLESNKDMAESIGLKNEVRGAFNQGIFHLTDIYNDPKLDEKEKLLQMRNSVVFLKSLLERNVNL